MPYKCNKKSDICDKNRNPRIPRTHGKNGLGAALGKMGARFLLGCYGRQPVPNPDTGSRGMERGFGFL
jgi:hypothetical protein